jgi:K+/H+ antiporter YhaU regulatory subunit KhtT
MRQLDQRFLTNPAPETVIEPEHILIAIGTASQLSALTSLATPT